MTKTQKITGYKVFKVDTEGKWYCDGGDARFYYEIGKTYTIAEKPSCCSVGFHFCEKLEDCFSYYASVQWNKIALVVALGNIDKSNGDSKCATNKIKIVKEIPFTELNNVIKNGVNRSYGVNYSEGVNYSYGILNSYGVDNALFLANKPRTYSIFGEEVTEVRYNEVYNKFRQKLNDWTPTFNNLRGLYQKFGQDWRFVPIPEAHGISKEEAWKDMPKEAIAYIASLPEFDREMFKEITGIEVAND